MNSFESHLPGAYTVTLCGIQTEVTGTHKMMISRREEREVLILERIPGSSGRCLRYIANGITCTLHGPMELANEQLVALHLAGFWV
jgi:hypothetical protein